ncbi:MAG: 3-oxoacyl-ACP synthase [Burkholderiaceae bacterium]|nr:MAG: 3-oxoacyl-ACP synthase [Burkholderiaceae bacterium]TBR77154.1 MAG: 3-oxoacyl-ACP synthase [Burkholderiaceae bacterium]
MTVSPGVLLPPLVVFLDGVGLLGPGFDAWEEGRQQLAGLVPTRAQKTVLPVPAALPAAERRRAGAIVKLTLAVGLQAVQAAGLDPARLPSVFASSGGDGQNCHEMCTALASPEKPISPTRFHNSVHNAASGYWGIATGSMAGSSVLCAFDGSFAAGLLEAITLAVAEQTPVLLLVYDTDYPEPLRSARPVPDSFGVALVLSPHRTARSLACIRLQGDACLTGDPADRLADPVLESLRRAVPAARGLPLLRALAVRYSGRVVLDYLDGLQLALDLSPCA